VNSLLSVNHFGGQHARITLLAASVLRDDDGKCLENARGTDAALLLRCFASVFAQDAPQSQPRRRPASPATATAEYRVRVTSELVLVNVVSGQKGKLDYRLKKDDAPARRWQRRRFTFDFENVDELRPRAPPSYCRVCADGTCSVRTKQPASLNGRPPLMLLFFDFSGMQRKISTFRGRREKFVQTRMQQQT